MGPDSFSFEGLSFSFEWSEGPSALDSVCSVLSGNSLLERSLFDRLHALDSDFSAGLSFTSVVSEDSCLKQSLLERQLCK